MSNTSQKYIDDVQFNTNYCVANTRFNAFFKNNSHTGFFVWINLSVNNIHVLHNTFFFLHICTISSKIDLFYDQKYF